MKILVTGGCGFIAHHCIDYLLRKTDHQIVSIDRLDYSSTLGRLQELESYRENRMRVKIVWHDLKSAINESVAAACGSPDIILHLAGNSHVDRCIAYPMESVMDNVVGTVNILEYARTLPKLKLIVVFSTDECFGPAPIGYSHKENDVHTPSNPYSAGKSSAVQFAQAYFTTYGLPVIITFTMNAVGERQHSDKLIPKTIKRVLAGQPMDIHCKLVNGKPTEIGSRVWIYAPNVADALWKIVNEGQIGERYNIIGFDEFNNLEVAKKVAALIGKPLIPNFVDFHSTRKGHDSRYSLDGSTLRAMDWIPPFSFDTGLTRTVVFTLQNQQWLF